MTKPPGPTVRDWVLLGISLTFVAGGIFFAIDDLRGAVFPLTFFGVCALTFGITVARKLRRRRFAATAVVVPGGVKLRGSNSRMLLLAVMIGAPGIAFLVDPGIRSPLAWICIVITLGGSALVLLGVVTGYIGGLFLRFDPPGLTIGTPRFEYSILWDQIANVEEFELHDNAVVGFEVLDVEKIFVKPESAKPKLLKALARNEAFSGRQVVIMAAHFAVPAESLCAAIQNYAANPEARAGLVPKPALGIGPTGRFEE